VKPIVVAAILALAAAPLAAQHNHGKAEMDIAVDGAKARILASFPADALWGFERAPKTVAERTKKEGVLQLLRTRATTLFALDAALGCAFAPATIEEHDEEDHADVEVTWDVTCAQPLSGKTLGAAGIFRAFPKLESIATTRVGADDDVFKGAVTARTATVKL
jgi:hypothetical protein